jgi:hypothetical protein
MFVERAKVGEILSEGGTEREVDEGGDVGIGFRRFQPHGVVNGRVQIDCRPVFVHDFFPYFVFVAALQRYDI